MHLFSKRNIIIVVVVIIIIAGSIILYFSDPFNSQLSPKCYFHYLTGYKCVGCGTQRALYNILHLRIFEGFKYNPILIIAIPYIIILFYTEYFNGKYKMPKLYRMISSYKTIYAILIIIFLYSILRNIYNF